MNTASVPPPEVHHARVNGVDLPYLDQGHGVPVVFVHGDPGDHRAWEGQREAVAERYRFIAPTQRYFGTGPWPDDGAGFSMATHADDLAAFVRQLRAGPRTLWDPGVVRSLQEGGDELLTFFQFPRRQWKTLRTTDESVKRLCA
jgi:hypothetical protein